LASAHGREPSGKTGVVRRSPPERHQWKQALFAVHREVEERIGRKLLRAVYAETGFDPTHP
jgi:C4-dicarboxylate-binding protein DctP